MTKSKRIGILGGTFNPIHMGHLVLAEEARGLLHLKKVIFVPANLSPHKRVRALAPAQERYHMVVLAVESNPFFEVSDLEIRRGGVSYSIETVKEVKSIFGQSSLYFIVGSDFLKEFSTWKDIEKLRKVCKVVIAERAGYPFTPLDSKRLRGFKRLPRNMQAIDVTVLDISSTNIRKCLSAKKSIRYLVPENVRKYILEAGLYR